MKDSIIMIVLIASLVVATILGARVPENSCTGVLQAKVATLEYKPAPIELEVDLGVFNRR